MAEGSKDENVLFLNAQDGVRGRNGGPYADEEDARVREIARARAEGREPDLDNPPPFVGNQVTTARFVEDNTYSNPSMVHAPGPAQALTDAKVMQDAPHRVSPGELPVDTRTVLPDSERKSQQKAINELAQDPQNLALSGADSVGADNDSAGGPNTASAQSKPAGAKKAAAKRTAKKSR